MKSETSPSETSFSRLNLRSDVENTSFHKDLPDSAVPVQLRQSYIKSSKKCVEDRICGQLSADIILFFPKPVIEFQLSDEDGVLLQSLCIVMRYLQSKNVNLKNGSVYIRNRISMADCISDFGFCQDGLVYSCYGDNGFERES